MIHCSDNIERMHYINQIKDKLGKSIEIFNGINTRNIKINDAISIMKTYDPNIHYNPRYKFNFYLPGQIGCYLSHHMCILQIMKNKIQGKHIGEYSVIFEDDALIDNHLSNKINTIITHIINHKIEFDIAFLGNVNANHGEHKVDNIYMLDSTNNCWGAHALLINNKNIEKLYKNNCSIKHEIDNHYAYSIRDGDINGFVIYPSICNQNWNLKSTIKK
jgi:GR25 family glycosyltransferase involved in LPS biosynthesis